MKKSIILVATTTALGLVIACSAPAPDSRGESYHPVASPKAPTPPKTDAGTPSAPPNPEPGSVPGTPPKPGGAKPGPGTTPACQPGADPNACTQCCEAKFPGSAKLDAAFRACMCTAPGLCKTQCGTSYCNDQQASDACLACQGGEQCGQQADQACASDPTCNGFFTCLEACTPQAPGDGEDPTPEPGGAGGGGGGGQP
jgi:hypothetical protein